MSLTRGVRPNAHFQPFGPIRGTRLYVQNPSSIFPKKICHFKQNYQMITLKLAKINEIVQLEKCRSFLSDKCNLKRNLIISNHQGKSNKTVHK